MKNHGSLEDFRLVLHGTADAPHHMKAGPRVYDEDYNTVQNERSEKRQSLKSIDRQQHMIESNKHSSNPHGYRQPISEEILEDINVVPNTDSHWLRLLARLNGNWVQ
jgi:hypothetical protein